MFALCCRAAGGVIVGRATAPSSGAADPAAVASTPEIVLPTRPPDHSGLCEEALDRYALSAEMGGILSSEFANRVENGAAQQQQQDAYEAMREVQTMMGEIEIDLRLSCEADPGIEDVLSCLTEVHRVWDAVQDWCRTGALGIGYDC